MIASKPLSRARRSARRSSVKKPTPQEQHQQLFTPQPHALRENAGRFEIFTLTDYSIPVYLAAGSGAVLQGK